MDIRYFDNAATTRIKEEVLEEMFPYLSLEYGNPSSIYGLGRKSKKAIDIARNRVARLINCNASEITFTSCGSESDNMALKGMALLQKFRNTGKNHLITSKIEHPAILNSCNTLEKLGFKVTYIDVDRNGFINLDNLVNSITDKTFLISIMFANNEIGTIEPIGKIAKIAKAHKILFHTDAVQAVGNVPIDVKRLGVDMLSLSGHKLYAPKGIGALYIREGVEIERFLDGGHQEKNKRSGTENVAGIVGLGKAIEIATYNIDRYNKKLLALRQYCISRLIENIKDIKINGDLTNRLPGNINVSFKGCDSSDILMKLDEVGICASGGSACSSGTATPSHVLMAIGLDRQWLEGTIRITLGDENTKEDIDYLVVNLIKITNELRNKG